jgi:hypothetical protein
MWQKNEFDQFSEFKSKGVEFEVGDKYLFRQLTDLLIRQSCQACSSKPLARQYNERCLFLSTGRRRSRKMDQVKDIKI